MSLFGTLHLGGASLAAQQTALQVTGNNIANAGTAGYTRQVVNLASGPDVKTSSGQYVGSGVGVVSVQRQVSESLNESLRDAGSDKTAADTLNAPTLAAPSRLRPPQRLRPLRPPDQLLQ